MVLYSLLATGTNWRSHSQFTLDLALTVRFGWDRVYPSPTGYLSGVTPSGKSFLTPSHLLPRWSLVLPCFPPHMARMIMSQGNCSFCFPSTPEMAAILPAVPLDSQPSVAGARKHGQTDHRLAGLSTVHDVITELWLFIVKPYMSFFS